MRVCECVRVTLSPGEGAPVLVSRRPEHDYYEYYYDCYDDYYYYYYYE